MLIEQADLILTIIVFFLSRGIVERVIDRDAMVQDVAAQARDFFLHAERLVLAIQCLLCARLGTQRALLGLLRTVLRFGFIE